MTTMNETMNFVATAALSGRGAAEGSGTHNISVAFLPSPALDSNNKAIPPERVSMCASVSTIRTNTVTIHPA